MNLLQAIGFPVGSVGGTSLTGASGSLPQRVGCPVPGVAPLLRLQKTVGVLAIQTAALGLYGGCSPHQTKAPQSSATTAQAVQKCRVAPDEPPAIRGAIEMLLKKPAATTMDGSLGDAADGLCSEEEAIHFIYHQPDWQNYLPTLDRMGLVHPLDTRQIQAEIAERARDLRREVDAAIGKNEKAAGYCEAFVPAFYEAGGKAFADGGLGFDYPYATTLEKQELTAAEAYAGVLDPEKPFGSCTEATAKIITAFRLAKSPCEPSGILTNGHMFARYDKTDLDPAQIGTITLEEVYGDAEMAGQYYTDLALRAEPGSSEAQKYLNIAASILPDNNRVHFLKARRHHFAGHVDKAVAELLQAIEAQPNDPAYYDYYTFVLSKLPRAKALQYSYGLLKKLPKSSLALQVVYNLTAHFDAWEQSSAHLRQAYPQSGHGDVLAAMKLVQAGRERDAQKQLQKVVERHPDHALALQQLASIANSLGDFQSMEKLVRKAIAVEPNLAWNHYFLSRVYVMSGRIDEAYREAKLEGLVNKRSPTALIAMAETALLAGDPVTAERYALEYLERDKSNPHAHLQLSMAQATLGQLDKARRSAEAAFRLGGQNPVIQGNAHIMLANIERMDANFDQAKKHLEEASRRMVHPIAVGMEAAVLLLMSGEEEQALKRVERLARVFPQVADLWGLKAYFLDINNRLPEARTAMERALQLNPRDVNARIQEISFMIYEGQDKAAVTKMKSLLREQVYNPSMLSPLAMESYFLGAVPAAEQLAMAALKMFPKDGPALFVDGRLKLRRGEMKAAVMNAVKLKHLYPEASDGYLLLAEIAYWARDYETAEQEARAALRHRPHDHGKIPHYSPKHTLIKILKARGKYNEAKSIQDSL